MKQEKNDFVKGTKEGRLYIRNKDFFKQEKVKRLVKDLEKSTIAKEINSNKKAKKIPD